jgi:hypothetical protein
MLLMLSPCASPRWRRLGRRRPGRRPCVRQGGRQVCRGVCGQAPRALRLGAEPPGLYLSWTPFRARSTSMPTSTTIQDASSTRSPPRRRPVRRLRGRRRRRSRPWRRRAGEDRAHGQCRPEVLTEDKSHHPSAASRHRRRCGRRPSEADVVSCGGRRSCRRGCARPGGRAGSWPPRHRWNEADDVRPTGAGGVRVGREHRTRRCR